MVVIVVAVEGVRGEERKNNKEIGKGTDKSDEKRRKKKKTNRKNERFTPQKERGTGTKLGG